MIKQIVIEILNKNYEYITFNENNETSISAMNKTTKEKECFYFSELDQNLYPVLSDGKIDYNKPLILPKFDDIITLF